MADRRPARLRATVLVVSTASWCRRESGPTSAAFVAAASLACSLLRRCNFAATAFAAAAFDAAAVDLRHVGVVVVGVGVVVVLAVVVVAAAVVVAAVVGPARRRSDLMIVSLISVLRPRPMACSPASSRPSTVTAAPRLIEVWP